MSFKKSILLLMIMATSQIMPSSVTDLFNGGKGPAVGGPLRRLNLSGKSLTTLQGLDAIKNISRARIINLADNKLAAIPAGALSVAENVAVLNLAGNKLTTDGLSGVAGLKNLRALVLNSNNVSDIPSEILDTLPKLTFVAVYNNPISDEKIAALRKRGLYVSTLPVTWANLKNATKVIGATLITLILAAGVASYGRDWVGRGRPGDQGPKKGEPRPLLGLSEGERPFSESPESTSGSLSKAISEGLEPEGYHPARPVFDPSMPPASSSVAIPTVPQEGPRAVAAESVESTLTFQEMKDLSDKTVSAIESLRYTHVNVIHAVISDLERAIEMGEERWNQLYLGTRADSLRYEISSWIGENFPSLEIDENVSLQSVVALERLKEIISEEYEKRKATLDGEIEHLWQELKKFKANHPDSKETQELYKNVRRRVQIYKEGFVKSQSEYEEIKAKYK